MSDSKVILPGATLGVLGGGQLGRMFAHAAQAMGYFTAVLDKDSTSPAGLVSHHHVRTGYEDAQGLAELAQLCAAVTTEFENVPAGSLNKLAESLPVSPAGSAVAIAQDRAAEKPDIQNYVNSLDIIYVGGGNTSYLLKTWRETGFDEVLKQAYKHGVILAGISAGAMCWFEHCYTQIDGEMRSVEGLGILSGSYLPHADEATIAPFEAWGQRHHITPLYALKDEETIHFVDERYTLKLVERMDNHV